MATMTSYDTLLSSLRSRIDTQTNALAEIADVLAVEAERCRRGDQASRIDALREQVELRVRSLQRAEESARSDFNMAKPGTSIAKAVGTGLGAWLFKRGDPIAMGVAVLKIELAKTAPFGNVVVALGPRGMPLTLGVISLSQMARDRSTSETEAVNAIATKGYRVARPESLVAVLDKLKEDILRGSVSLPVTSEQVRGYLAAATPKAETTCLPAPTIVAPLPRLRQLQAGRPTPWTASDSVSPSQGVGT